MKDIMKKMIIGWKEWAKLPGLGIDHIICKIDTGAAYSALHIRSLKLFEQDNVPYVTFTTGPLKKKKAPSISCTLPVASYKKVKSSNGIIEERVCVTTPITIGNRTWSINVTLTNRSSMQYPMLLGRKALRKIIIEPHKTFCQGKPDILTPIRNS